PRPRHRRRGGRARRDLRRRRRHLPVHPRLSRRPGAVLHLRRRAPPRRRARAVARDQVRRLRGPGRRRRHHHAPPRRRPDPPPVVRPRAAAAVRRRARRRQARARSARHPQPRRARRLMAGHICVFISSTFRDMQDDHEVLIKRVFPQLRKRCETRGIAWTEIDLRWGVTSEQQAEGKLLPYCFQEIERSRPYFIGLLAGRYGWVPAAVPEDLERLHPWLVEHRGCSVTELEILHGVLNDPGACNRALFYFRDPAYAAS